MRRRCLLAEQLEPRLVLSVVGIGSRGAGVSIGSEAPPSDDSSIAEESSSGGGSASEFTATEAPAETMTAEPSPTRETTDTDATPPPQTRRGAPNETVSDTDARRPSGGSRDAKTFDSSPMSGTTASSSGATTADDDSESDTTSSGGSTTSDSSSGKTDTSATTATRVLRLSPSVGAVDLDTDTGLRVIVLRRVADADETNGDESDAAGDSIIPRRELETSSRELATVTAASKVIASDATSVLQNAANRLTDDVASQTTRAALIDGDSSVPVASTHDEGWLNSLASSIWSWLGIGDATNLTKDTIQTAELPLVAFAGMFTFATLGRKGTADDRKFAPPTTDERFELTQRRSWRERRRGESRLRNDRGWQRPSGRAAASPVPADNRPTLAQPDISEAFVMSLMDSVEPDAFVMSMLPTGLPDDDSSEKTSDLSPSMKLAVAGAAISGAAVAGNALANRRGSKAKRPARSVVRYTGTTVVPQSSRPQAARS